MRTNDLAIFAEMWASVRVDIYDKPVSKQGLELIFKSLQRFSIEDIQQGIQLHVNDVQNGNFPITPAHVVAQIEGRGDERAGAAWRKLYGAIGSVGNYADVVFDDRIIHAVIDNEGGWQHVALMTEEELKYMQSRFNKQYNGYVSKSGMFEYPRVLRGAANSDRASKNIELLPPETVGNIEKCREIYRGGVKTTLEISRPKNMADFLGDAEKSLGVGKVLKLVNENKATN